MKKQLFLIVVCLLGLCALVALPAGACTNLLVTQGASEDGSAMITYTCDGEFHPIMEYLPRPTTP